MNYKKYLLWAGAALLGLFLIYWFLIRSKEPNPKLGSQNTSTETATSPNTTQSHPIVITQNNLPVSTFEIPNTVPLNTPVRQIG